MLKRKSSLFTLAAVFLLLAAFLSLRYGAADMTLGELWATILAGPEEGVIFYYARLPRTAAALLSGAALSVSGCILQRLLGNHLASPGIIGVNAGAGFAVTCCCALGALGGWSVSLSAFGGALAAAFLVMSLARATGASRTTVILAGVAMNSILGALSDAVITLVPEAGMLSGEFRVGGFSAVSHTRLIPAGILILLSLAVTFTMLQELDVLALGEDTAKSLGLHVGRIRTVFLLLAALMAGAAVSFAGLLGFVGLLVPHLCRRFAGSESRYLLPLSALVGAGFVTLCDVLARVLFAPYELYVGILLSLIGGPFFLFLLLRKRGGHGHA